MEEERKTKLAETGQDDVKATREAIRIVMAVIAREIRTRHKDRTVSDERYPDAA